MANFKPNALKKILNNEGNYSWDKDDSGGETWQGIARNINPGFKGWVIIDAVKAKNPNDAASAKAGNAHNLNLELLNAPGLQDLVNDFYEVNYWDVNNLSLLNDQQLADNVCDCGVNCGTGTGAKMLQNAYNATTNPANIPPLTVDGKIGKLTIGAINALNGLNPVPLYNEYNVLRKAYYDAIIARNPVQAKFRASWYSRIIPYKS